MSTSVFDQDIFMWKWPLSVLWYLWGVCGDKWENIKRQLADALARHLSTCGFQVHRTRYAVLFWEQCHFRHLRCMEAFIWLWGLGENPFSILSHCCFRSRMGRMVAKLPERHFVNMKKGLLDGKTVVIENLRVSLKDLLLICQTKYPIQIFSSYLSPCINRSLRSCYCWKWSC